MLTATCEIGAGGAEEGAGSCSRGAQAFLPARWAPAPAFSQTLSSQGFLELRGTHFSSKLGRAECWDLEGEGQPPAGSFLLGPLSCWGLLREGPSIPVVGGCRGELAAELQEVGPQGSGIQSPELQGRQTRGHLGRCKAWLAGSWLLEPLAPTGISENDGELSKKTLK